MGAGRVVRGLAAASAKRILKKAVAHKQKVDAARKASKVTKPLVKPTPKVEAAIKKIVVKGKKSRSKAGKAAKLRVSKVK